MTSERMIHIILNSDTFVVVLKSLYLETLPKSNITPENSPCQKDISSSNLPFLGAMLVSGRMTHYERILLLLFAQLQVLRGRSFSVCVQHFPQHIDPILAVS